jgi:TRAP-type C4-dicarboxylate transport system permease small subunit|tara:strand:+ start:1795 stop:2382 length:588 start_codon:yes stop_codon:yes gene_type:complete
VATETQNQDDVPASAEDEERGSAVWLRRLSDGTSSLILFCLMAMTCVDVVGRYFFNSPLDGATELTQLAMGVIVFAVLPTVSFREDHVSVDLLDIWFPDRLINSRQILMNIIAMIAMGVVTWRMWIIAERTVEYGDATEFLEIPYAPMYFFISAMCGATAIAIAFNIPRYLRGRGPLSPGMEKPSSGSGEGTSVT